MAGKLCGGLSPGRARLRAFWAGCSLVAWALCAPPALAGVFRGEVVDAATGKPLAARVYVQRADGQWFFARATGGSGTAVEYKKSRGDDGRSVEMHTTVSAHPFEVELPAGEYTVTVERGKEYLPLSRKITMADQELAEKLPLTRFVEMASMGWYSGDTHVHRTLEELPNVQLAEDVNVTFPLVHWVREAYRAPPVALESEENPHASAVVQPIALDAAHVIYPRNTEYEIFTVDGKPHTLGAVFILNHKKVLDRGVPPLAELARQAHAEGAILELDRHNWPWSMAIVPIMNVDLFELANNHHWRTEFHFKNFGEAPADWMKVEKDENGLTELGWTQFGFENYYTLLNCGLNLRPTAGTASGVHPVPLGFGRVYVHLGKGKPLDYQAWLEGLNAGRSFVTTGPLLRATINSQQAGHRFTLTERDGQVLVVGEVDSLNPLKTIELIGGGEVLARYTPTNERTRSGSYQNGFFGHATVRNSTWLAIRCMEDAPGGRTRFAHTAPWFVDVAGRPRVTRRQHAQYLVDRVRAEIERSEKVLAPEAVQEYRQALKFYEEIAAQAQ